MMPEIEHIVDYKRLLLGTIEFNFDGTIKRRHAHIRDREIVHKDAVLSATRCLSDLLERRTFHYLPRRSRLFVSSDVKMPRDLLRKSGYELKRDPDSAYATVIPYLPKRLTKYEYNIAFLDREAGDLYLYSIEHSGAEKPELSDEQKETVRNCFFGCECLTNDPGERYFAHFISKCQEYHDLINGTYPSRNYIFENNVNLYDIPVQITVENLLLWEKVDDRNLLRKTILNSNWREYPLTLCVFLRLYHRYIDSTSDIPFKQVMRQIKYESDFNIQHLVEGIQVEPQDWNMLQMYILAKMGLKEEKGFVNVHDYLDVEKLRQFIPMKVAVRTLKIDQPMLVDNLLEMIAQA
jgi:hypothetical protein